MAIVAVVAEAVTAVAISPAGAVWRLLEFGQKKKTNTLRHTEARKTSSTTMHSGLKNGKLMQAITNQNF